MIREAQCLERSEPSARQLAQVGSWKLWLMALTFAGAFGLSGCSDESFSEGGNAKISVDPVSVAFSPIPVGQSVSQVVKVRNLGTDTLILPADLDHYVLEPSDAPFSFRRYMTVDGETVDSIAPKGEADLQIAYVPVSEGASSATLTLKSTNGGDAVITISTAQPVARLQVTPNPVAFGGVANGATIEMDVLVENKGNADLQITSLVFVPTNTVDFTVVETLTTPTVMKPGDTRTLRMRYAPTGDIGTPDRGDLIFTSNTAGAGANGQTVVPVTGGADSARIEIEPIRVDFGGLDPGQSQPRQVLVRNVGEDTLAVSEIGLQLGTSPDFSYAGPATLTLAPGESQTVDVTYAPTNPGTDTGYLYFLSNDPTNPSVSATLLGSQAGPQMVVQPPTLTFGSVALGVTKTLSFDIINDGLRDLTISGMTPTGFPSDDSLTLSIDGAPVQLPLIVSATTRRKVSVTFAPTVEIPPSSAQLLVEGNDAANPDDTVAITFTGVPTGSCEVALVPIQLNFGLVPGGAGRQMPVNVVNQGAAPCSVNNVAVQTSTLLYGQNPFQMANLPFAPFILGPGESRLVFFDYFPFSGGDTEAFAGQAVFTVQDTLSGAPVSCQSPAPLDFSALLNGGGAGSCFETFFNFSPTCFLNPQSCFSGPPCWACLQGTTGDPALAAVPGVMDFGLVTLGCRSRTTRIKIYNKGNAPTSLTRIAIDPTCSSHFAVTGIPALPQTLNGGQFIEVEVVFTPSDIASTSCRIEVEGQLQGVSPAPPPDTLTIPLSGEGTTESFVVDEFEQVSGRKVDVLFVVDNSGSMSEEQQTLASSFNAFISAANTWNIDYQLGVITTDSSEGGKLKSSSASTRILTPSTPNVEAAFAANVRVGTNGSSNEQGLRVAESALSDPTITANIPGTSCPGSCPAPYSCDTANGSCGGFNATFLRQDATLEIVFLSDEEDSSPADVGFYVDFFKNIKGYRNDGLLHAHAIIGDSSTCNPSNSRYKDVANQTNGVVGSLCGNFSSTLSAIGNNAFGLRVEFFLSRYPEPATIKVYVDGVERTTGWSFDPNSNSVVFLAGSVPAEGQDIRAEYRAACF
jgi:hypothetical protein